MDGECFCEGSVVLNVSVVVNSVVMSLRVKSVAHHLWRE